MIDAQLDLKERDFCEFLLLLIEQEVVFSKSFCFLNYLVIPHERPLYLIKHTRLDLAQITDVQINSFKTQISRG